MQYQKMGGGGGGRGEGEKESPGMIQDQGINMYFNNPKWQGNNQGREIFKAQEIIEI